MIRIRQNGVLACFAYVVLSRDSYEVSKNKEGKAVKGNSTQSCHRGNVARRLSCYFVWESVVTVDFLKGEG